MGCGLFKSIVSDNYVNKVTVNTWLHSYILPYDLFFALLTWWAIFRLVYFTRTWLILNFVAKTCLVWQDPIMMKYIDISVVPCVTIWNSRKWIQICFVCWMSIVYACCLLYVIVKTVKDLLLFLQKWMYIWNKHRSFPRSMKSMFTMSSGLIKCG